MALQKTPKIRMCGLPVPGMEHGIQHCFKKQGVSHPLADNHIHLVNNCLLISTGAANFALHVFQPLLDLMTYLEMQPRLLCSQSLLKAQMK